MNEQHLQAQSLCVEAGDYFVARLPLLPFDTFLQWTANVDWNEAQMPQSQRLSHQRAVLRERLRAWLAVPGIMDALFLASPSLTSRLDLWLREPLSKGGHKVEIALAKYFSRMTSRSTPFGLLAGITWGKIANTTCIEISPRANYRRRTELNTSELARLAHHLSSDPALRLDFSPNESLHLAAGCYRYLAARHDGRRRTYVSQTIEATARLETALRRAANGAGLDVLANHIEADEGPPLQDRNAIDAFLRDLVARQVLVPQLGLALTGAGPLDSLVAALESAGGASSVVATLSNVRTRLQAIDRAGLGAARSDYESIRDELDSVMPDHELSGLFRVDMVKPATRAVLGSPVVEELKKAIHLLACLMPRAQPTALSLFRREFGRRYQDSEVPLLDVLSRHTGIGFPITVHATHSSFLLEGLSLPGPVEQDVGRDAIHPHVLIRLLEAGSGAKEIVLDEREVVPTDRRSSQLPSAFSVRAAIAAQHATAIDHGEFQLLFKGSSGPSGIGWLGRFCPFDPALSEYVKEHLASWARLQSDAVVAEVIHLPEGDAANVAHRPVLSDYEIPYLGASGLDPEYRIEVSDLTLSLRGDRLILRSCRLGRDILPRLTSAHNYDLDQHGVYAFLCSIQQQNEPPSPTWRWGVLDALPYLPRVRCGRIVLARARWRVLGTEVLQWVRSADRDHRYSLFQNWRKTRSIPRWIVLADGDHELLLDSENPLCVDVLSDLVQERSEFILTELFPAPDQLWVRSVEGTFLHEVVVPFVRQDAARPPPATKATDSTACKAPPARIPAHFTPGSDWLYVKIYTGPTSADLVLKTVLAPCIREAVAEGCIDRWFFVRSCDPDWHLRLRIHGRPETLVGNVLPALRKRIEPAFEDGTAWKTQFDTYFPEVRRYGGPEGLRLSEALFHGDSDAVLAMIEVCPAPLIEETRWQLALAGVDRLLSDFELDLSAKAAFAASRCEGFRNEFGLADHIRVQLNDKFRDARTSVADAVAYRLRDFDGEPSRSLERRSRVCRDVFRRLQDLGETLSTGPQELLVSYAHMFVNRLFPTAQREQEMVVYELLFRHYSSAIARQRAAGGLG
jgi:thiopeptide-type bacteriocin biosynthesis protein